MRRFLFLLSITLLCFSCGNSNKKSSAIEEWMVGEWDFFGNVWRGKIIITDKDYSIIDFEYPAISILNASFVIADNGKICAIDDHVWRDIITDINEINNYEVYIKANKEHHCFEFHDMNQGGGEVITQSTKSRPGKGAVIPYAKPVWVYVTEDIEQPMLIKLTRQGAYCAEGVSRPSSVEEAERMVSSVDPVPFGDTDYGLQFIIQNENRFLWDYEYLFNE